VWCATTLCDQRPRTDRHEPAAAVGEREHTIASMERDVLARLRDLIASSRVLSLAVIVDGEAEAALLPFVPRDDLAAVYVQASVLARHSRGLIADARVGLLVHAPDTPDADPLQLRRLTVQAVVSLLPRETSGFAAAARFVGRFPAARTTLALEDFNLYELAFGRGRYVEGFGRAFNVGAHTFGDLSQL